MDIPFAIGEVCMELCLPITARQIDVTVVLFWKKRLNSRTFWSFINVLPILVTFTK